MLLPVSGLFSWGVALGGTFMALSMLGVNVQPLLAVGGVGGIVLGWSAQSIFGNALSGITLVCSWGVGTHRASHLYRLSHLYRASHLYRQHQCLLCSPTMTLAHWHFRFNMYEATCRNF